MIKNYAYLTLLLLLVLPISSVTGQNNLQSTEYGTLIINYLEGKKSDFNFKDRDLEQLVITNTYYSESTDITQVYLNQTFQGIKIFNIISSVAIKDDQVFYYANRFLSSISDKVNATEPVFSPISAIQKVATHFELGITQNIQQLEYDENRYVFTDSGISTQNIVVELVYVKSEENLKLAWDFIIYTKDSKHWWNVRVNAVTNEIIEFNEALEDEPEKVNTDPYGDGWMVKIKCSDTSELEALLSADDYKTLIGA